MRITPAVRIFAILTLVLATTMVIQSQAPRVGDQPVVLELFTSQGCSSCPSADALLRRIARDPKLRDRVIPLAYHVDYWDRLGWRDPFSSPQWTQRQGDYVRAMNLGSAYTPQLVVNGSREMVGSNSFQVNAAIEEESRRAREGEVHMRIEKGDVVVRATTKRRDVELVIVTFENGAKDTRVERGENTGRTVPNDAIVRSLTRGRVGELRVPLGRANGAAAFLQQTGTRRIVAAATASSRP